MSDRETTHRDHRTARRRRGPVRRHRPGVEGLEGRQLLSYGGSPDLTFGTDGYVAYATSTVGSPSNFQQYGTPAIQTDGKILVTGELNIPTSNGPGNGYFAVIRYNADGSADTTFGTNGVFTTPSLSEPENVEPFSTSGFGIAVQSDGKIVVAGYIGSGVGEVIRLNTDGTLDTTFGTGGIVTLGAFGAFGSGAPTTPTEVEGAQRVALLPGGQIAIAGGVMVPGGAAPAVEALNADGSVDTSFGTNGLSVIPAPTGVQWFGANVIQEVGALAVGPDGTIVLQGNTNDVVGTGTVFIKLNTDGSLDSTFGQGGEERVANLGSPEESYIYTGALAIQSDGKIVTGSPGPGGGLLAIRLDANGTLDTTFGQGGYDDLVGPVAQDTDGVQAIAFQANGEILLAAYNSSVVARLDPDGLPDPTFGEGGITKFSLPDGFGDFNVGIFPLADGDIQVGTFDGTFRLLGHGSQGDYNNDGISDPAALDTTTSAFTDAPSGGGTAASTVIGDPGVGLTLPAPGAYNGNGISEVAVYRVGSGTFDVKPYAGGPDVITAFGIPGFGNTLPAPGDYDGSGQTELAVYLPQYAEFAYRPAGGGPDQYVPLGIAGAGQSIPVPADYFGTGRTDFAVYLPAIGAFEIHNPVNNQDYTIPFGTPGAGNSIPVPGDYDGSGHAELAVYLPASGDLIYRPYDGGPDVTIPIGTPGVAASIPEVGDFDGSGHDEAAVYNPADGTFVYQPAAGGSPVSVSLGTAGQTVPFSLGTDSVAEEGTGAPSGSAGALALPATVPVPLTQDVLDTLNGTTARKKEAGQG